MQNLRRKSKGVRGRGLKTLWKWATEHSFFVFIFDIYYIAWKIVKYIMSYTDMHHWYNFLKNLNLLSLIWGHLSSLQLIYRLTHLSSFRRILGSYRIILNIFRVFWVQGSAAIHIETSHLICIGFKWLVSISNATLSYNRVTCNLSSVLIISPEFAYF